MRRVRYVPDGMSPRNIHGGPGEGQDPRPGRVHGMRCVRKELSDRRSYRKTRRGMCELCHSGLAWGIEVILHMLRRKVVDSHSCPRQASRNGKGEGGKGMGNAVSFPERTVAY